MKRGGGYARHLALRQGAEILQCRKVSGKHLLALIFDELRRQLAAIGKVGLAQKGDVLEQEHHLPARNALDLPADTLPPIGSLGARVAMANST